MFRRIFDWFQDNWAPFAPIVTKPHDLLDLIDPRYRAVFSDEIKYSGIETRRPIRLDLNKNGYSILVGRKRVHFISRRDIEADFYADDFTSLDRHIKAAAHAVICEVGKK